MRIIHAVLSIVLIAFTLVQYNDPDYLFWMPIYGVPAILAAIAAGSPHSLHHSAMRVCISLGAVLGVIGTIIFWPREEFFWRQSVWWQSEVAREGMGMMIVTTTLLILAAGVIRRWRAPQRAKLSAGSES